MGIGTDEFSAEELALIPPPDDAEQQAAATNDAESAEGEQQSEQPAAEAKQEEAQQTANEQDQQGEERPVSRQALRAARRSERIALQRLDAAQRELEALRQRAPQQSQAATEELSDEEIAELTQDIPAIGKLAATVKALKGQLQAATAAAKQPDADPEFVPPYLPPEVQEDVDEVPELLAWQTNPDQAMFTAAVQMDNYLRAQKAWADKPQAERFAEVVRRVKQDAGIAEQAPQPTKQRQQIDPKAAIEAAPRRKPASLSDLTGGLPQPEASTLDRFQRAKSDDEILAILDRLA